MTESFDRDALKGLTRRELEAARELIDAELRACIVCGNIGATAWNVREAGRGRDRRGSLLVCTPCFDRSRLPEREEE